MPDEEAIRQQIKELEAEKKEREDSLPAHSVRPQQIVEIEELESAIAEKKKELEQLKMEG
ncbi:MAG: hypothetical protein JXA79_09110 [Deltaproteobacteria bacterium]|nr:hypothetical protein [Deltaproteobacteria bacterium]